MVTKARPRFSRAAILAKYPHYWAIRAASDALKLPVAYRRDLTLHDRRLLAALDPKEPFVWMVRESGTHLVVAKEPVHGTHKGRHGDHPSFAMVDWLRDTFTYEPRHFFTWDGAKLRPVTVDGARAFLRKLVPSAARRAS